MHVRACAHTHTHIGRLSHTHISDLERALPSLFYSSSAEERANVHVKVWLCVRLCDSHTHTQLFGTGVCACVKVCVCVCVHLLDSVSTGSALMRQVTVWV